jgi:tetrahydromethanopterin S-methyltransferase subunit C
METFWKWFYGMLTVGISAAASGVTAAVVAPASFNFSHAGLIKLAELCGVNAMIAVAAYLKQSPLPPISQVTTVATTLATTTTVTPVPADPALPRDAQGRITQNPN